MAFNKVSMVIFVLLVVAATAPGAHCSGLAQHLDFCSACSCNNGACTLHYRKIGGGCPMACIQSCHCSKPVTGQPDICFCSHPIESCNPRNCASGQMNLLDLATFTQQK